MLSIANVGGGQEASRYYEKSDDYYTQDSSPSQWQGKLAKLLKFEGEVRPKDFEKLLDGIIPHGEKIQTAAAGRRGGTDLTFSAPKSVSMQALIGIDKNLIDAHDKAVSVALQYAETLVNYRQTIEGITQKVSSKNMIAATFRHELSRDCDPQLHTHCVVINMTRRPDGQWRAMDNELFYKQKMLMGVLYRAELAREIQKLGYRIRTTGPDGTFELAHFSDKQLEQFSQRSQAIEEALKAKGKTRETASSQEKQIITIATRAKKTETDRKILGEYWLEKSLQSRIDYKKYSRADPNLTGKMVPIKRAVYYALKHTMERQSVVTEAQIVREALQAGMGEVTYQEIKNEIQRRITLGVLIQKGERYTTPEAIKREEAILSMEMNGRNMMPSVYKKEEIQGKLEERGLNRGQKEAVSLILKSENRVIGVQGFAGSGKTYMLEVASEMIRAKGFDVIGLAPSTSAVQELSKTGIISQTIPSFEKAQNKNINSKTIIVIDEAGMVPSRQMEFILAQARDHQAKVVLLGDTQQLKAVEAGKPFAQLQAHGMETAGMSEIQRQRDPELKKAVEFAARGQIVESVNLLHKSIEEISKSEERHSQIAKDYTTLSEKDREKTLIVTGTNYARKNINQKVRENLGYATKGQELSLLERQDFTRAQIKRVRSYKAGQFVRAEKRYSSLGLAQGDTAKINEIKKNYIILQKSDGSLVKWKPHAKNKVSVYSIQKQEVSLGETMRITQNDRQNGLVNGNMAKVIHMDEKKTLYLQKEDGKTFTLDGNQPLQLEHGYCSTVHSAQGKTCERVLIDADTKSLTSARDNYYVAISRARQEAKIYTDDRKSLPEAMSRENHKTAALDLRREPIVRNQERKIKPDKGLER